MWFKLIRVCTVSKRENKMKEKPNLDMGASTVKWTTLDPYLVLSESDSILCTNFEFCEEINHRHF